MYDYFIQYTDRQYFTFSSDDYQGNGLVRPQNYF